MSRRDLEPADPITEHHCELMRQNDQFAMRMTAALKSGAESAAAMTATVRTGRPQTSREKAPPGRG